MQPGKPVLVARHTDGRFAVGLPGNPVSVLATAQLILAPVIGRFWRGWQPQSFDLPLACDWRHAKKRRLFLPARLIDGGVEPIRWNGSGDLLAAASGDGLVEFLPQTARQAGDLVRFFPSIGGPLGERGQLPPRSA